jgi:hypothetical protein
MKLFIFLVLITFSKVSFAATKWNLYSTGGFSEKIIYYTPIIDPKPKVEQSISNLKRNVGFKFEYHCKQKRFVARIMMYNTVNGKFISRNSRELNIVNEPGFEGLGLSLVPDGFTNFKFKSRIDGKMTNLYGYVNNRRFIKNVKPWNQPILLASIIEFGKKSSKKIFKAKLVTFEVMTKNYGNLLVTFDAQNLPPCKK